MLSLTDTTHLVDYFAIEWNARLDRDDAALREAGLDLALRTTPRRGPKKETTSPVVRSR
jgi:hypothetical protein